MQCYRELGILTARPSAAEEREVPHRLYGHRSAREPWSAGIFSAEAAAEITAAWQRQALPVITGGTGLYLRVLEHGLTSFPPIPAEIRQRWREALRRDGVVALHSRLAPEDRQAIRPDRPCSGGGRGCAGAAAARPAARWRGAARRPRRGAAACCARRGGCARRPRSRSPRSPASRCSARHARHAVAGILSGASVRVARLFPTAPASMSGSTGAPPT